MQYTIFIILAPVAAIVSIFVAVNIHHFQTTRGSQALSLTLLLSAGYAICSMLEVIYPTRDGTLFWAKMSYTFVSTIPVAWLAFAFWYSGKEKFMERRRFWIFLVIPVVSLFMVFTNELHLLFWRQVEFRPVGDYLVMIVKQRGPWFWIYFSYAYLIIFANFVIISRRYFSLYHLYRQRSFWVILGAITPLAGNLIYVFQLIPGLTMNYSPITYSFGCIAIAIGIYRYKLLEILPVASTILVDNLSDGVIFLDVNDNVVDINPAAKEIIDYEADPIGVPAVKIITCWEEALEQSGEGKRKEITICKGNNTRYYDIHITMLNNPKGRPIGRLATLHDVTERTLLLKTVETLATVDTLTDLLNRRHFLTLAQRELDRSRRYEYPLSIILIDLDRFKNVNDTFGHLVGDHVLREFASQLQRSLRIVDVIARFGGDEFVALLPETNLQSAIEAADRLRRKVAETPFITESGNITVTLSIGITSLENYQDINLDRLLEQADRALYKAKTAGRNQVIVWNK
jgi:diguanylate cyclase (GGDEF)-like protein